MIDPVLAFFVLILHFRPSPRPAAPSVSRRPDIPIGGSPESEAFDAVGASPRSSAHPAATAWGMPPPSRPAPILPDAGARPHASPPTHHAAPWAATSPLAPAPDGHDMHRTLHELMARHADDESDDFRSFLAEAAGAAPSTGEAWGTHASMAPESLPGCHGPGARDEGAGGEREGDRRAIPERNGAEAGPNASAARREGWQAEETGGGVDRRQIRELEEAVARQSELQAKLLEQLRTQQELQKTIEANSRYINSLLQVGCARGMRPPSLVFPLSISLFPPRAHDVPMAILAEGGDHGGGHTQHQPQGGRRQGRRRVGDAGG